MHTCETIEDEFDNFFELIGYERVTETVGMSPDFENADYESYEKKVSLELKVIDKDYFKEGGVIDKLRMIVATPKNVKEDGTGIYSIRFPDYNREGRPDTIEEPLRRLLKKSNRQLRQTNEKLFDKTGFGLVMIALNMATVIDPFIIRNLIHDLVSREFRSIAGVMICTPKVAIPIEGTLSRLFVHTHDGRKPNTVLEEINRIADAWCEFANNGGHGDDEELDKANSIKPSLVEFPPW